VRPRHHRFDKGSYVYLFENAGERRARIEIANNPGRTASRIDMNPGGIIRPRRHGEIRSESAPATEAQTPGSQP
jgi:hypothetical protein